MMFGNDEDIRNFGQSTSSSMPKNHVGRLSMDSGLGNDSILSQTLDESQIFEDHASFSNSFSSTRPSTSNLDDFGSPPTKWARIRTPPQKKAEKGGETKTMFSPPANRGGIQMRSYVLKTPESLRKTIRISTPSPIQVTFSKTPLKLSNNENVARYHIGRKEDIVNINSMPMIRCIGVTGSASKRCILPNESSTSSTTKPKPETLWDSLAEPSNFEGFNELPLMTPSKINALLDDDEAFEMDLRKNSILREEYYQKYEEEKATTSRVYQEEEDRLTDLLVPGGRREEKKKEEEAKIPTESYAIITSKPLNGCGGENQKKKKVEMEKDQEEMIVEDDGGKKQEIEMWTKKSFVTPTKDVKLYSGQWLVISTGRTSAQRELLSDAISIFKQKSKKMEQQNGQQRKIATISRVNLFKHKFGKKQKMKN